MAHPRPIGLLAASLILAAPGAQRFAPAGKQHVPDQPVPPSLIERFAIDLDGDGLVDIVDAAGTVLHQTGRGVFAAAGSFLAAGSLVESVLALADLDGDGDTDAVVRRNGLQTASLLIYENRGSLVFQRTATAYAHLLGPAALDVDGDGDLDLVGGVLNRGLAILQNDGGLQFTPVPNTYLTPRTLRLLRTADFDRDGDGDLVGISIGGTHVLANDGAGRFRDVTATAFPQLYPDTVGLEVFDADGDGDADVMLSESGIARLLINDGAGVFTDESSARLAFGDPGAGLPRDIDGDGDLDLVLADFAHRLNDGTGVFRFATGNGLSLPPTVDLVADLDGDGDLDGLDAREQIAWNDGRGVMQMAPEALPRSLLAPVASVDLDGDGAIDVVELGRLYRNDGLGNFTEIDPAPSLPRPFDAFTLPLDIDGDGDADLIHFGAQQPSAVWENLGGLAYRWAGSAPSLDLQAGDAPPVAADVDGDGDLDLIAVDRRDPYPVLLRNDGLGSMVRVAGAIPRTVDPVQAFALLDVDRDGDFDLVVAPVGSGPVTGLVYSNDGTGRFVDSFSVAELGTRMVAADLDRDGSVELASVANATGGGLVFAIHQPAPLGLLLGSQLQIAADVTGAPAVLGAVDVDGDFQLDLIASGNARFDALGAWTRIARVRAGSILGGDPRSATIEALVPRAAADLDGDGDLDFPGFVNRIRQTCSPYTARLGSDFAIEIVNGGSPSTALCTVFAAPARRASPLPVPPLGQVLLDGATAFRLADRTVPGRGSSQVVFAVPGDPALVGAEVFFQSIVIELFGQARLTNATRDVILR